MSVCDLVVHLFSLIIRSSREIFVRFTAAFPPPSGPTRLHLQLASTPAQIIRLGPIMSSLRRLTSRTTLTAREGFCLEVLAQTQCSHSKGVWGSSSDIRTEHKGGPEGTGGA